MTNPSGEQWTIRRGDQEATVVEVGGGLRTYAAGGLDLVAGYAADEMARAGRGQLLMPWPNRIRDGRYAFAGAQHQLALTEPARHNASHGLVRWVRWQPVRQNEQTVRLTTRLHPQPGWDGTLDLVVAYTLGDEGLTVTTSATNVGTTRAPFGCGAHPYVAIGDTALADVVLHLPAQKEVLVDDRLLPTHTDPVQVEHDFRSPRRLASTSLDTAYTGLHRDPATGHWEVTVSGLAGRPDVTVWGDEAFDWVQVFTTMGQDTGVDGTRGIAVEPMSCPPDAFNSGQGLVVLAPGESWSGSWGISAASAPSRG